MKSHKEIAIAVWSLFSTRFPNCGQLPRIILDSTLDKLEAGNATPYTVRLNPFYQNHFNVIIPHELAHVIQYRIFSYETEEHGAAWKMIMEEFGFNSSSLLHI